MNKKVMFLLLSLFVITSVFATQSRMSGLGNPDGLIEDDTDVFTYPATIFDYSSVVVGEIDNNGSSTNWSMGANIPIMEYKLGVYLNRDTGIVLPGAGTVLDISKSAEFSFGFMDKFAVGFGTSADYLAKDEIPIGADTFKNEPTANFYSFFGGYSANNMDFGFRVEMANAEDIDNNGEFFEMSKTFFRIDGRQIVQAQENLVLVVKAGFEMDMSEMNYSDLDGEKIEDFETSDMALDLAFGLHVKANDRNTIIFGLTPIIYSPSTIELTDYNLDPAVTFKHDRTTLLFPEYNLAVESKINSWLTGRMGANQSYEHVTDTTNSGLTDADDIETLSYVKEYNMNLGLTFSFGNFCVDSVLQQELLFDGPNFLGGKSNGLASEISVKYKF